MKFIDLANDLDIHSSLNEDYITLYGRDGTSYRNKALEVPGFGMIPCSWKLRKDFTNDSEQLLIIQSDPDDKDAPYTSKIWITRKGYVEFGNWDDLEESKENDSNEELGDPDDEIPFEIRMEEMAMTIEEYCEKYDLDIEKGQVLEEENSLIIPNKNGTNSKKIIVNDLLARYAGYTIEDKSEAYELSIFEKPVIEGADAEFQDIDWYASFLRDFDLIR